MKKILLAISILALWMNDLRAQNNHKKEEKILKEVYQILEDFKQPKDSLIIFAINFTLTFEKKVGKLLPKKITANDSLAYQLFPSYKKLRNIDFSAVLGTNTSTELFIPILIYGASPDKMYNKDQEGRPLINLNAAVNASLALTSDKRYSNLNSSDESFGRIKSTQPNRLFKNKTIMEPYIITIMNIP